MSFTTWKVKIRQMLPPQHSLIGKIYLVGKKVGYKIKIHILQAKQFEDIYKGFILNDPHIFYLKADFYFTMLIKLKM